MCKVGNSTMTKKKIQNLINQSKGHSIELKALLTTLL